MDCIFQRFWHTNVHLHKDGLLVDTIYNGTDRELCARMVVEPETFMVQQAWWEIYRGPGETTPRHTQVDGLMGMKAYFGCGETLKAALAPLHAPEAKELFAEGVRGVIQAETFLVEQRGYVSPQQYEEYWDGIYQDACRYYSNMERVTTKWYEHVGYYERTGCLFNRMKSQFMYRGEKAYLLAAHLHDSFHSVAVELELEKNEGLIIDSRGDILRAPDLVCKEASVFMEKLKGTFLPEMKKKEIAFLLGAGNGCVHLIDLVTDGAQTFFLCQNMESN